MLRSRAEHARRALRRVTEWNAGRLTAGVDGEVVLTSEAEMQLVDRVRRGAEPFEAAPVRRVYIPKRGGKRRPLGIPVILDRVHQARVVNALEPECGGRGSSGGPMGSGRAAAARTRSRLSTRSLRASAQGGLWALDADLASAFDLIAHQQILDQIGSFPARGMVRQWLKAGVVERGRLHRTEDSVPQGGVVSPLLLNVALHGMEKAAGVRYYQTGDSAGRAMMGSPVLIRYADDFVALATPGREALRGRGRLTDWLAPGVAGTEETLDDHLADGFDFLGFNVRRYHGKLLIKPSKAAVRRIRERLRTELSLLRGSNAPAVIKRLRPDHWGSATTTGHT